MYFFNRLFGAYYFMLIAIRKITKTINEDSQASGLVWISQICIIFMLIALVKNIFDIPGHDFKWLKYFALPFGLALMFINDRYYVKKRERRNAIIDEFRVLSKKEKRIWKITGIMILPITILVLSLMLKPG